MGEISTSPAETDILSLFIKEFDETFLEQDDKSLVLFFYSHDKV
jgi:hypothetical protein